MIDGKPFYVCFNVEGNLKLQILIPELIKESDAIIFNKMHCFTLYFFRRYETKSTDEVARNIYFAMCLKIKIYVPVLFRSLSNNF